MGWFDESVAIALNRQDDALKDIFGSEYSIHEIDADRAIVRSKNLEWRVWFDRRRNRSFGSELNLGVGESWEYGVPLERLARFLGENGPTAVPRNASGIVELTIGEQIELQFKLLRRLTVLADPQLARDAAYFARGYNRAYTDYASGEWDVA